MTKLLEILANALHKVAEWMQLQRAGWRAVNYPDEI